MKFPIGEAVDTDHSIALHHEFLRCHDAFTEFYAHACSSILFEENRWLSFKMYNAYSSFIHHLYEFMVGALARDLLDTEIAKNKRDIAKKVEMFISGNTQRILTNKCEAIKNGTAPVWENDLSAYPETIPPEFAKDFREYRNKVAGHVSYERSSMSLTDFYDRYHLYLHMLYRDALLDWGLRGTEFPDMKEITDFTVRIKNIGLSDLGDVTNR
jgi:hypothetical protein